MQRYRPSGVPRSKKGMGLCSWNSRDLEHGRYARLIPRSPNYSYMFAAHSKQTWSEESYLGIASQVHPPAGHPPVREYRALHIRPFSLHADKIRKASHSSGGRSKRQHSASLLAASMSWYSPSTAPNSAPNTARRIASQSAPLPACYSDAIFIPDDSSRTIDSSANREFERPIHVISPISTQASPQAVFQEHTGFTRNEASTDCNIHIYARHGQSATVNTSSHDDDSLSYLASPASVNVVISSSRTTVPHSLSLNWQASPGNISQSSRQLFSVWLDEGSLMPSPPGHYAADTQVDTPRSTTSMELWRAGTRRAPYRHIEWDKTIQPRSASSGQSLRTVHVGTGASGLTATSQSAKSGTASMILSPRRGQTRSVSTRQ
ncbi:hypothetical protein CALCODRAFT_170425 [Calocera cornea HHB12733]|uniref:Uncharacterized protein n=1 Tax=Calocera cornea HHB12733 TaxID=1353952 RepID=A0A165CF79_9BASI|nr:hypothetical protein CALCODRAFT_170425 [Calocera cornea HHB12733]